MDNTINFTSATPEELIKYIDNQLKYFINKQASRFSLEWGMWSSEMNRSTRKKAKDDSGLSELEKTKYNHVFAYWVAASNLLEIYAGSGRLLKKGKIRVLKKEMRDIKVAMKDAHSFETS